MRCSCPTTRSATTATGAWYVSDRIWRFHHIPWSMPVIGHGRALAFPYALVCWAQRGSPSAARGRLDRDLVVGPRNGGAHRGDVLGVPGVATARRAAAVLVNPALVVASIIGQLPFLWGASMLMGGAACWRRRRYAAGRGAGGLGQATTRRSSSRWGWYSSCGGGAGSRIVEGCCATTRRRLGACDSRCAAVFASPVFGDSHPVVVATSFFGDASECASSVLAIPIALVFVNGYVKQSTAAPSSVITHFPARRVRELSPDLEHRVRGTARSGVLLGAR